MTDTGSRNSREYIAALTGLRGVAAFFVFLFHYHYFNPDIRLDQAIPVIGVVLQFPLGFGFVGVDLFFVLSGFLLTLPFARARLDMAAPPDLKRYFRRRVLRVFPAYYAQLLFIAVVGAWFVTWKSLSTPQWVAHLFMLFNAGPDPVRPMVGVWWTLPVELGFYLLLPLLALLMRPSRWLPFLVFALAASVVYRWWAVNHFPAGNPAMLAISHLPGSLPEFLMGASAALLAQIRQRNGAPQPKPWVLDSAALVAMAGVGLWIMKVVLPVGGIYWEGHWSMLVAPIILGILMSALVLSVYLGSRIGRWLFANRVVYGLGLVSYSLYLWHFVVLQQWEEIAGDSLDEMSGLPRFLLATVAVIVVSTASYWLVERPFYRLRKDPDTKTSVTT